MAVDRGGAEVNNASKYRVTFKIVTLPIINDESECWKLTLGIITWFVVRDDIGRYCASVDNVFSVSSRTLFVTLSRLY